MNTKYQHTADYSRYLNIPASKVPLGRMVWPVIKLFISTTTAAMNSSWRKLVTCFHWIHPQATGPPSLGNGGDTWQLSMDHMGQLTDFRLKNASISELHVTPSGKAPHCSRCCRPLFSVKGSLGT